MVVGRRRKLTQPSIPRSRKLQIRLLPPSLEHSSPKARTRAPSPNHANALAPFPSLKYFPHSRSLTEIPLFFILIQLLRTWHRGEAQGDHQVPEAQSSGPVQFLIYGSYGRDNRLLFGSLWPGTLLAPWCAAPKSEGSTPSPLGLAAAVILSCSFFINVLSLARELEKNTCGDLDGVATVMWSGIRSRYGGAVSLTRWYARRAMATPCQRR
jgi:hypothetical protein